MADQKMVIEIDEDGQISVDLNGFKGKGCSAIMDIIEEAVGPAARKNKPEYDTKENVQTQTASSLKLKA